jgi:hypothetical protein
MFVTGLMLAGMASGDDLTGRESLNATLWMQRAPEYRAIAEQVYRMAALFDGGAEAGFARAG